LTQIAFLLYPDMTALDAIGPYDVLARLPGADVRFVASTPGQITTDVGMVLTADSALDEVPAPDIVVVPGGPGTLPALQDGAAIDWLRQARDLNLEGKVITAAGVSAGIDMALRLAALEAGEDEARTLQLVIEYDPDPPFDSGSLEKADPETQRRATEHMIPSHAQADVSG
jgi:putative intracellular protease/amidase